MQFDLDLYLVTDRTFLHGRKLEDIVEQSVRGGVTMVQLREKDCSSKEFFELATRLKKCLKPYHVPLIINDRLDIALAVNAEGLHIGQSDMPYTVARKLLGYDKIIGLSVENLEQATQANLLDVDYIGISPVFSTSTKTDTAPAFGIDGVKDVTRICRHRAVGIGGINKQNAHQVIAAGVEGISVVSAIMDAANPQTAAQELKQIVIKTKQQ